MGSDLVGDVDKEGPEQVRNQGGGWGSAGVVTPFCPEGD